jgi:hypothetical protein
MATHQEPAAGLEDVSFKRMSISSLDQAASKQSKSPGQRHRRKSMIAGLSIALLVELAAVLTTFFVLRTANRSSIRSQMMSTVDRIHDVVIEQFRTFDHTGRYQQHSSEQLLVASNF